MGFAVTMAQHSSEKYIEHTFTYFVLVKNIEDKCGKFSWVSKGEELFVDLLETGSIQLATGTIFDEAFIPADRRQVHYRSSDNDTKASFSQQTHHIWPEDNGLTVHTELVGYNQDSLGGK